MRSEIVRAEMNASGKQYFGGQGRGGAVVVELAATLPIFLLILVGTIEATSMVYLQQSLKISSYEGSRVSLIPGSDASNVTAACNEILSARSIRAGIVSISPSNFETQPYGTKITVTVQADCSSNSLFSPWFYAGRSLSAQTTMMKER